MTSHKVLYSHIFSHTATKAVLTAYYMLKLAKITK